MIKCAVILLPHSIELEDGVEVHQLDTSDIIYIFLRDDVLQIVVHRLKGDRITIGSRIPEDGVVFTDKHEVNTPGINTYRGNLQSTTGYFLQSLDDFKIEGEDIPVIVSSLYDEVIGEAGHLLEFKLITVDTADNRSAARGTQVYGKEIFIITHILYFVDSQLFLVISQILMVFRR